MPVEPGTDAALKSALKLPMLTYPAIFVRGSFLGGFDQLTDAVESGNLQEFLVAEWQHFPSSLASRADPVQILRGPRGQSCYAFQLHTYANFIRMLSFLHVALFAVSLTFTWFAPVVVCVIFWIVLVDLSIFVLLGPTPLAPICTVVMLASWRFRGNIVSSIPYKVIFAVYVAEIAANLFCGSGDFAQCIASSGTRHMLSIAIFNSSLLAVFRF